MGTPIINTAKCDKILLDFLSDNECSRVNVVLDTGGSMIPDHINIKRQFDILFTKGVTVNLIRVDHELHPPVLCQSYEDFLQVQTYTMGGSEVQMGIEFARTYHDNAPMIVLTDGMLPTPLNTLGYNYPVLILSYGLKCVVSEDNGMTHNNSVYND